MCGCMNTNDHDDDDDDGGGRRGGWRRGAEKSTAGLLLHTNDLIFPFLSSRGFLQRGPVARIGLSHFFTWTTANV